jgi:hypothetical protein
MDNSILNNTKKILGLPAEDTSFDTDVILLINSAFSILTQLGVGPAAGFTIVDAEKQWAEFVSTDDPTVIDLVKTCIFLRVRLNFDPPQTSHLVTALEKQLQEHEWRLSELREALYWADPDPTTAQPPVGTIVSTFEEVIGE